jgi:3-phenylpropionate/trans-cinnamate dioxygenase ferredoxin subunit
MGNFTAVCKSDEVKEGQIKHVMVQGRAILIANVGGRYYAVDGRCPHLGGRLAQGELEGTVLTCPRHGSQFDIKDGHVVRWLKPTGMLSKVGKILKPEKALIAYNVKIVGGQVMVEVC